MSDPRLKAALTEIQNVLQRHDLTGVVIVASDSHIEHETKLQASWTCATYDGETVRFDARRELFLTDEAQTQAMQDTVGVVAGVSDVLEDLQEQFKTILQGLGEKFGFVHRTKRIG